MDKLKFSCAQCNKDVFRSVSKARSKSGLYFCDRVCKSKAQCIGGIRKIMPKHYGTSNRTKKSRGRYLSGYRKMAFTNLPLICADCTWNKYTEVLEVHHIDGNHHNNVLENLVLLCPTCHMTRHFLSKSGRWIQRISKKP